MVFQPVQYVYAVGRTHLLLSKVSYLTFSCPESLPDPSVGPGLVGHRPKNLYFPDWP